MDGQTHSRLGTRTLHGLRRAGWFLSGMAVVLVCLALRWYAGADRATAKPPAGGIKKATATERMKGPPPTPPNSVAAPKKNPVAAIVNNEPISREELATECLMHYGSEVLESLVNRTLIKTSCDKRGIVITEEEVQAEIERMAKKFQYSKDAWLKTLEKERGILPLRYAQDIIWPTLALRQLAKDKLQISQKELDEAYDSEFGPSVKVRLISMDNAQKAREIHARAVAKPEEFPALAKKFSKDTNSASAYGLIQPIRHHLGDPQLEAAAFAMKKGQISKVMQVGEMHVFIMCEEQLPPPKGVDRAKVEPLLIDALRERKLRAAANDVFKQLQTEATVVNVYNDTAKSKEMPGVAAVINGQQLTIRELADECVDRHGKDVLTGMITRRMIEQTLKRRNLKVGEPDIDAETARAALAMGKVKSNGDADVDGWIEHVTQNENISREVYIRDEVWPSAALKLLVGKSVQVSQEDLKRGYEANYGPKVQCRAIVINNQRKAQEVWDQARENPTSQNFGDLAEKHSMEAGSRALRGEVPPIQKHGGQPVMEQEAFSLSKENPLSGIIQAGNSYVILFYEGQTKPIDASFAEVKDLLYRDIQEKKMRLAMAKTFDQMKDNAQVDNFLTGEIKAPKRVVRDQEPDIDPGITLPKVQKR